MMQYEQVLFITPTMTELYAGTRRCSSVGIFIPRNDQTFQISKSSSMTSYTAVSNRFA